MIISKFKRELNGDVSEIRLNTGEKLQNVEYLTDLEEKTVTENGTYTPSTGKVGFSKVVVNVPTSSIPSVSSPTILLFTQDEYTHYVGVLSNGNYATLSSDIPNIKWFVTVEGNASSGREVYTSSQDSYGDLFNDYFSSSYGSIIEITDCEITIDGETITINNSELETITMSLSGNIPLALFTIVNATT